MAPSEREEFRRFIKEIMQECFHDNSPPCGNCGLTAAEHRQQHLFVAELIETMGKINNIKWSVVQAVVVALIFALLTYLGVRFT